MKQKVPIQKWMMFVDKKIVNFMKKVQKRLRNQNLSTKKIRLRRYNSALLMVLRGLGGERRSAGFARLAPLKNYSIVGSGRQFRLGGHPTTNGRYPTSFSIKQI